MEGVAVVGIADGCVVGVNEGGEVGDGVGVAVGLLERAAYVHVKALDMPK